MNLDATGSGVGYRVHQDIRYQQKYKGLKSVALAHKLPAVIN
jgi:hypothetical protein